MVNYSSSPLVSVLAVLLCVCSTALEAQTVVQTRYTIDQGGGKGSGAAHTILQSVGQAFVQKGTGSNVVLAAGFLTPEAGNAPSMATTTLGVADGWNMLSVPLDVPDFRKSTIFPTAVSNAFMFTTMYVAQETLKAGVGYWVKFRGAEYVGLTGYLRPDDTIGVLRGWNLIGTVSGPIEPASVVSVPGGMVVSNFFSFENFYVATDSLRPGKGYWVKVADDGVLIFPSPSAPISAANRIRIIPDEDRPPDPPEGMKPTGAGALPPTYALYQNFPNPFNPSTEIRYDLPEAADVLLRVYNILGEEVVTLAAGVQEAGYRSVRFDAADIPSGVYFYRLTVGPYTSVQKMITLK